MKTSRLTQVFTFFIAAQFLNVQIQTAFGSEAITANSSETKQLMSRIENRLEARLRHLSEAKQIKLAYRIYKKSVHLRNKLFHRSDRSIDQNLKELSQYHPGITDTENSFAQIPEASPVSSLALADLNQTEGFQELIAEAPSRPVDMPLTHRQTLLMNADAVLTELGSTVNRQGDLTRADFQTFQEGIFKLSLDKSHLDRHPANALSIVLKVILSLLVLMAGFTVLLYCLAITAFAGFISIWILLIAGGALVGMFFAIKGIFSLRGIIHNKKSADTLLMHALA